MNLFLRGLVWALFLAIAVALSQVLLAGSYAIFGENALGLTVGLVLSFVGGLACGAVAAEVTA